MAEKEKASGGGSNVEIRQADARERAANDWVDAAPASRIRADAIAASVFTPDESDAEEESAITEAVIAGAVIAAATEADIEVDVDADSADLQAQAEPEESQFAVDSDDD